MKVGSTIKKLRLNKNWSLQILSEKTGIAVSTLSDFETDKYLPNAEKLKKLADIFGVKTDDLLRKKQEI